MYKPNLRRIDAYGVNVAINILRYEFAFTDVSTLRAFRPDRVNNPRDVLFNANVYYLSPEPAGQKPNLATYLEYDEMIYSEARTWRRKGEVPFPSDAPKLNEIGTPFTWREYNQTPLEKMTEVDYWIVTADLAFRIE